jgi:acylpyruvate hydrolase
MKIVAFEGQGGPHLGVVEGEVVDLQAAESKVPADIGEWLSKNNGDTRALADIAKRAPAAAHKSLSAITYALPVGRSGKIICLGLNYLEQQRDNIPKFPTIFMRGLTSMVPHGQPIIRPKVSETPDYEAELILVVGKRAEHLTPANATSCIAGYSCGNEGSVREFQRKMDAMGHGQEFRPHRRLQPVAGNGGRVARRRQGAEDRESAQRRRHAVRQPRLHVIDIAWCRLAAGVRRLQAETKFPTDRLRRT